MRKAIFISILIAVVSFINIVLFASPRWYENNTILGSLNRYDINDTNLESSWLYNRGGRNTAPEEELSPEERERRRMHDLYDDLSYAKPIAGLRYGVIPDRRNHWGIDVRAPLNEEVLACEDGVVTRAEWIGNYGKVIFISHPRGLETRYSHLARFTVSEGDRVEKGQVIGYVGLTGRTTGPHVHFEIRKVVAANFYGNITTPLPLMHQRFIIGAGY